MNLLIVLLSTVFISVPVLALDLKQDIIAKKDELHFNSSNGPRNRDSISEDVYEIITSDESFYESIIDGYNHDAIETCENEKLKKYYLAEDGEITSFPDADIMFTSIKKSKKGKSIAYIANPVLIFSVDFNVFKTESDFEKNNSFLMTFDCPVQTDWLFVYENIKGSDVKYMGYWDN